MNRTTLFKTLLVTILMLLAVAACGRQVDDSAQIDADEIAQNILTQLETKFSSDAQQPDQAQMTDDVVATVSAQSNADPVDADAITAQVLEKVEQQLADQGELVATSNQANAAGALALQDMLVSLYDHANPATVYVVVPPLGSGSGFVYDDDGHIVTNNHVVSGGSGFEVVFANGERREAEVVGADVDSDLAVIKVKDLPEGVEPLPLADPASIKVGQFVIAIGNPFGEQGSMSLGIISGLDRSLRSQRDLGGGSAYSLPEVIQTDAPINPGNSGGPLINLDGQVVGVNSAIRSASGTNSGVGFAVPVAAVHRIVPNLIENGKHEYSYMGVGFDEEVSLDEKDIYGLAQTSGAYVLSIVPGGPAAQAGLEAADRTTGRGGDLVVAINGSPIRNFSDLNSYLVFHSSAGDTIDVTVVRDGEEITFPMELGARP